MKNLFRFLVAALVASASAYADVPSDLVTGCHMHATCANQLSASFGSAAGQSILPATTNTYDLGSSSKTFRYGYFGTGIVNSGDEVIATAAKGFVAGASSRAAAVTTATTLAAPLYLSAAAAGTDLAAFVGTGASTSGPVVDFFKTRATSGAASTIVTSGDSLGTIKFFGANGTTYDPAAAIIATSDGTPGASADMPGALDFQVSPDGSATLASALKLANDKKATFGGKVVFGTGGPVWPASMIETVAAGTSAQGDGPLTANKFIHLVTGFDETKVATLPACATANIGEVHFILNNTTNKFAKIFPASGGTINSLSANAAYTQGVTGQGGKVLLCACQAANQWYCA